MFIIVIRYLSVKWLDLLLFVNKVKGKEPKGGICVRFNIKIITNFSLVWAKKPYVTLHPLDERNKEFME